MSEAVRDPYAEFLKASKAAADPLRGDILRVLERDSFGVLELCHILDVAQPALSHHLKVLLAGGLVTKRREGNSIFYRRALADTATPVGRYLESISATLDALPMPAAAAARIGEIHARRAGQSRRFFDDHAEAVQSQQALICPSDVYARPVAEALDATGGPRRRALEVGPGDGGVLCELSVRFADVLGIDNARPMLERARARMDVEDARNVRLKLLDFTDVPARPAFDAVVLGMVLHHAASPPRFFEHAAVLLGTAGVIVVAELCAHDQEWVRDACGDQWLGFEPAELDRWAASAALAAGPAQYLAQRNGFRIQIRTYRKGDTR